MPASRPAAVSEGFPLIDRILRFLHIRCPHKAITFPMTLPVHKGAKTTETTVVCQNCKRRIPYSWERMEQGRLLDGHRRANDSLLKAEFPNRTMAIKERG